MARSRVNKIAMMTPLALLLAMMLCTSNVHAGLKPFTQIVAKYGSPSKHVVSSEDGSKHTEYQGTYTAVVSIPLSYNVKIEMPEEEEAEKTLPDNEVKPETSEEVTPAHEADADQKQKDTEPEESPNVPIISLSGDLPHKVDIKELLNKYGIKSYNEEEPAANEADKPSSETPPPSPEPAEAPTDNNEGDNEKEEKGNEATPAANEGPVVVETKDIPLVVSIDSSTKKAAAESELPPATEDTGSEENSSSPSNQPSLLNKKSSIDLKSYNLSGYSLVATPETNNTAPAEKEKPENKG